MKQAAHSGRGRPVAVGLLRGARPRHWLKNVLVLAAPLAAGVIADPGVPAQVGLAFVAFSFAASGAYLVNDVVDAASDRAHPTKRTRPVASGDLPPAVAVGAAVVLLALGVGLPFVLRATGLGAVIALYVAITIAYSVRLRAIAVVDLLAVASGFFLRAVAGGVATGVELSGWFLIVAGSGALFLVAGKRHADHVRLGADRGDHRATLDAYDLAFLRHVLALSSIVAVLAYCLWAFETADPGAPPWLALSIVPFAAIFLRYAQLVFAGEGGEPEELLLRDRGLLAGGAAWAVLVGVGLFVV